VIIRRAKKYVRWLVGLLLIVDGMAWFYSAVEQLSTALSEAVIVGPFGESFSVLFAAFLCFGLLSFALGLGVIRGHERMLLLVFFWAGLSALVRFGTAFVNYLAIAEWAGSIVVLIGSTWLLTVYLIERK